MTVWTTNILYKHHAAGDMRPRLWGDNDAELLGVLYGIGAGIEDRQPNTSWENYLITPEQQQAAVDHFGVIVTDYLEPRMQRAEREEDWNMVASITMSRAASARGQVHLLRPLLRDPLARHGATR